LEDIYVEPEFRKHGIGKKLLLENVKFAKSSNCKQLGFQVWNENPAKGFYEKMGAKNLTAKEGWEYYRIEEAEMNDLLK
jgi:diamine N-acetyltransferase